MQRYLIAFVSVLACFLAFAGTGRSAASESIDPDRLHTAFFRTVFGLEYDGGHVDAQKVKRYSGPVRFHVEDRSGTGRLEDAWRFLQRLPRTIGHLEMTMETVRSRANFRVILVRDRDFSHVVAQELNADAIAMNARCLVGVSTLNGRIERSTAVIVADDDFLFERCLVEEVLQGLGPMNDDDSLSESVFNDRSPHAYFTAFDQALMNVLYHPLIRPGMTGSEAQVALPFVMRDLGYVR